MNTPNVPEMDRLGMWTWQATATGPCLALQTHPFIDQQHPTIYIAQKGLNRIAVLGERIQQVFGDDGAFDLQSHEALQFTIRRVP